MKTEDLTGCIEVARAQGWSGMAEEADDELTQLEGAADSAWNAALEAAALKADAMRDDAKEEVRRSGPQVTEHAAYWTGRVSSAALLGENIRALKREAK